MRIGLSVLVGLLVVAHLFFFALEAIFWETDLAASARDNLNFNQQDQTEVARVAKNQGLSNAFLAAGLVWGLWRFRTGRPAGRSVLTFFLGFIVLAGLVGYLTIQPKPTGAAGFLIGQTGFALAALACLYFQKDTRGTEGIGTQ
jgi:putative membrane protein